MPIIWILILLLGACSAPVYREVTPLPQPVVIAPPAPKSKPSITKRVVLIDAGHGGEDFGAHSVSKPVYHEKNLTLATSKLLQRYLEQMGYEVRMTRTNDLFVPLEKRADVANKLEPAIFVSVHYNSAPAKEAHGIEVYFYRSQDNKSRTQASRLLAQKVLDQLIKSSSAKSRGIKHGNFLVIRETNMPAILVECGFLTHEEEMARIKNPAYTKKLAWGIAEGVREYLEG